MLSGIAQVNLFLSKFLIISNANFFDVPGDSIIRGSMGGEMQNHDLNTPDSFTSNGACRQSREYISSQWDKIIFLPGNLFLFFFEGLIFEKFFLNSDSLLF
jgi:hypothetical protein